MENKKRIKRLKNNELTIKNVLIRCGAFTILFCIIGFLITLIASYFLYKTKDPTSLSQIAGISSLFIAVFLTSFIQSKVNKQYYFFSSLILGILIFSFTFILSLVVPNNEFQATNLIWRLLIPVFSVLGGALGIKRETKKRKHHR